MGLKKIWDAITGKKEKIDPPDVRAVIRLNPVAKESGMYDDENKIIEVYEYGRVKKIKYSEADVDVLRENGIPVLEEEYSDEYDFINGVDFGNLEFRK